MDTKVKELMIPIERYPTISQGATCAEAAELLQKAHQALEDHMYRPRSILVVDDDKNVVGKVNFWSCLRALEPKYGKIADFDRLTHFGLNPDFVKSMVEQHELWTDPLDTICQKAAAMDVKHFMSVPSADEYIEDEAVLASAVHQLLMGRRLSLLVTKDNKVVGILRLCDAMEFIFNKVKACKI